MLRQASNMVSGLCCECQPACALSLSAKSSTKAAPESTVSVNLLLTNSTVRRAFVSCVSNWTPCAVQILLIFLQKMDLLLTKTPPEEIKNSVLPMVYRALEAPSVQIQVHITLIN